jgi:hypothetical protein
MKICASNIPNFLSMCRSSNSGWLVIADAETLSTLTHVDARRGNPRPEVCAPENARSGVVDKNSQRCSYMLREMR